MVLVSQELHAALKIVGQEVLSDVQTLQLVHGLDLLLALHASVLKGLVLDFDALNFAFDFLLPVTVFELSPLVVLILVLSNGFELFLLFDLEGCLVD